MLTLVGIMTDSRKNNPKMWKHTKNCMIRLILQTLSITGGAKMKTFVILEKYVGYADITIEAETEEEALALYNRGHYLDSNYNIDDMFYDYQFNSIREETNENN